MHSPPMSHPNSPLVRSHRVPSSLWSVLLVAFQNIRYYELLASSRKICPASCSDILIAMTLLCRNLKDGDTDIDNDIAQSKVGSWWAMTKAFEFNLLRTNLTPNFLNLQSKPEDLCQLSHKLTSAVYLFWCLLSDASDRLCPHYFVPNSFIAYIL